MIVLILDRLYTGNIIAQGSGKMSNNHRSKGISYLLGILMVGFMLASCTPQPVQPAALLTEKPSLEESAPTKMPNLAPQTPDDPAPVNGAVRQGLNVTLAWSGGDLNGDSVTYTVYLAANDSNPHTVVSANQSKTTYYSEIKVIPNTTYYWKIVAKDAPGASMPGPIWNFTTGDGSSSKAIHITAGGSHTCAITSVSGVKCWGYNGDGQLGDGTTTNRWIPIDVTGLSSKVVAIAAGNTDTCALTIGGGVKCWGDNDNGELGEGNNFRQLTPVDVIGLSSDVVAITAGFGHTCALTDGGGVKCWGANESAQLGNGTADFDLHPIPVDVVGLSSGVKAIAAGGSHTCALTDGGGVKCWGDNFQGELGNGTMNFVGPNMLSVGVVGLSSGVVAITAGNSHTCALTNSGGVKCWGDNKYGQLGDGTTTNRWIPMNVAGLSSGVVAIAAGDSDTCALTTSGKVKCWGWNESGQLGEGTTVQHLEPVNVTGLLSRVATITGGGLHSCVLTIEGGIKCWGWNDSGQLGNGTTTNSPTPVDVVGFP
jgi:alpha-tubulin suppressor-like RCC1 family protein